MRYLLAILILCCGITVLAQGGVDSGDPAEIIGKTDSTVVEHRQFNESRWADLKEDPELNYAQPPSVAQSLWGRFLQILAQFIAKLFAGATSTGLGRLLLFGLGIVLLIFLIMMVMRVDAFRVFYSGADRGTASGTSLEENIHELDFDKLIREAIEKGQFRLGVRLVFLQALKILSDKQVIQWQIGKTNHDYVDEIKDRELKTGLNELSFYFDYAWYGNFNVDGKIFSKTQNTFDDLKRKLGKVYA